MATKPQIDDPLFGTVTIDGDWWYGTHHSAWIDEPVGIMLPLELDEPTPVQRRLFKEFKAKELSLQSKIETAIFNWYREYVQYTGVDFDYSFPDVTNSANIWDAVEFGSLCIPDMNDDDRFEVLFEGEWENEHGFYVALKKWMVDDVLYQGSGY